jgi:signal transduction histidine kinase
VASERDVPHARPLPTFPPGRPAGPSRAPRPPLTKRMRTGHWVAIDCVVAAFTALLVVAAVRPYTMMTDRALFPIGALVAAGVFVPVALRRRAPLVAFGALLTLAVMLSGMTIAAAAVIFLTVAYALYAVTITSSKRTGAAALGLVLAIMLVVSATGPERPTFLLGGAYVPVALANVLAWTVGYSVRQRRLYVVRLQQQAASSAVAEERLRIARELHDVVAHSMSVIAVQAGYGQYVIDDSPDGAREALGAIQATSREALDEMRRMLGVLRAQDAAPPPDPAARPGPEGSEGSEGSEGEGSEGAADSAADGVTAPGAALAVGAAPGCDRDGPAPLAPAPGLANLDRLIKRTCGAGVRVDLEIYGQARPLPAGLDLSAFRIIQEALTNVVKHAGGGARCTVHLGYDDGVLAIRVTDDGGQSTTLPGYGGPGAGHSVPAYLAAGSRAAAGAGASRATGATGAGASRATGATGLGGIGAIGGMGGWRMPADPSASTGHGIIGMRERAHLCGGELTARPLREGGFQVTASLPLTASRPAETVA